MQLVRWFVIISILGVTPLWAQNKVPRMNTWRVHLPYFTNNAVAQLGKTIYVGSNSGLFMYDEDENSTEMFSKVNGLSDVEVALLAADETTQSVVVVYENTNIDIFQNGFFYNISNLLTQSIIGEKKVNDVAVYNGFAYLATTFGIVKIDLRQRRIVDSYQNIGPNGSVLNVFDVAIHQGNIYASSPNGLFRANTSAPNLSDYNFWTNTDTTRFNQLLSFNNSLYAGASIYLFVYNGIGFDSIPGATAATPVTQIKVSKGKLLSISRNKAVEVNGNAVVQSLNERSIRDAVYDSEGFFAAAIDLQGLILFKSTGFRYIIPDGPASSTAMKFAYSASQNKLFVAGGLVSGLGAGGGWKSGFSSSKYYIFDGKSWTNGAFVNNPLLNKVVDLTDVVTNEQTNQTYFTSFGGGVLELTGNNPTQFYDTSNSKLGVFVNEFPDFKPVYAAGSALDDKGNLWVTCYGAAKPIAVKTPANIWYNMNIPSGLNKEISNVICDDAFPVNNKWIANTRAGGLYVYNEGSRLDLDFDDKFAVLSMESGKGALPSNTVLCMAFDLKGTLWIGTDKGLCFISNPTGVFTQGANYDARQIIFNTGSFNSIFLGTEPILCIKVDGANRKWIGTRNGVWLVSEDGYTVIRNFTTENSPLLSNTVYDIGIFEETGEVFFATDRGIISYAGDATRAGDQHNKVLVYPNPVKPEYDGMITIRGLANNVNVKITDISGNLVYETTSNGGMATWNGRTFSGKRAATGVYLIYSSNEDATETYVTKLLFIN